MKKEHSNRKSKSTSKKAPKAYETYERVLGEIVSAIFKRVENIDPKQVTYGRASHMKGISGFSHQIDAVVRGENDVIMVDCKCWKKKVSAEYLLAFLGRIKDIEPTLEDKHIHPVMVTTQGFQKGVKQLAQFHGIDLQMVKSPTEFGFKYKTLLLVRPAPANAVSGASDPGVVISG